MNYQELIKSHPHLFDNRNASLRIITNRNEINAWHSQKRSELEDKGRPLEWADIGVVLNDPYTVFIRDLVEFPNKERRGYLRSINQADLQGGQGIAVLPVLEGKIILLKQYRHATRQWHLEIPRGYGEPHTSAEENAKKEIEEEMGAIVERLIDLGDYHINTGIDAGVVKMFLAYLIKLGKPENGEGIEGFVEIDIKEFENMIANEKITDGFTISTWAKAKSKGIL